MTEIKRAEGKLTPDDMLSASQVATVMDMNPYQTPNEPLQRAFDATRGIERVPLDFEALEWGNVFEIPIIEAAVQRLGLKNPKTTFNEAYFHPDIPLACSLDATVEGDGRTITVDGDAGIFPMNSDSIVLEGMGVIEAKLTSQEKEMDLPAYRGKLQLQAQMMITGAKWGAVCVLYRGITLRIFVYGRDEEIMSQIRGAAVDFERRVKLYKENDETDWYEINKVSDATRIYDSATDDVLEDDSLADDVTRIKELEELMVKMKGEIESCQTRIMSTMRDYKHLVTGPYRVTWGELNYKATPEKVVPAKPARTIRVSKLKIKPL